MVCPIIVEDLNQPLQMLWRCFVRNGLFLEIADIIRGLGLTILKGVMETRNEKIWAQFAVERCHKDGDSSHSLLGAKQRAVEQNLPMLLITQQWCIHSSKQLRRPATGRACSLL
ncbi:hypothetical protein HAX54_039098 [Datura stramonium]|uniref:Uncharacterized protein n=1 Tax=Datura stramonium TaxID=4076 RepID=A0ABS8SIY2_DATST|nr:hypothetical protein [Datura stramonium]